MPEIGLFIRLYLDADVDVKLAANLRRAGYDCVSARKVGNAALDDESQMVFATNEGRVLLTHNIIVHLTRPGKQCYNRSKNEQFV